MGRGRKRTKAASQASSAPEQDSKRRKKSKISAPDDTELSFIGDPIPSDEAESRWPHRYQAKSMMANVIVTLPDGSTEEKELFQARAHYRRASVDGVVYELFDDAYFQAPKDESDYIAKIIEMFETISGQMYICTQWYFRVKNTIINEQCNLIDSRRVFYSDLKDDNPLDCITKKAKIIQLAPDLTASLREEVMGSYDHFVDMKYTHPHGFSNLNTDMDNGVIETQTPVVTESVEDSQLSEITVLDLFCGCGAMSSGLGLGASLLGEKFVTKWAVDFNLAACDSMKANHPNAEVRNEDAERYYLLLKEWQKLCKKFNVVASKDVELEPQDGATDESEVDEGVVISSGELGVEKLVGIRYGDPKDPKKTGLYFQVRWEGFGPRDDTWEPISGLSNCEERIKEFVTRGYRARTLPLPGDVDFICGGPPCQGISGFNRYRARVAPLENIKNHQLAVYMDIVEFLQPRYVLMENVTDILKYAKAELTSYAVGRLVGMNYQARLGIMAAGAYGVPQCRMRFFLWGARPTEILPQFPLPTHEALKKGVVINEYKELIIRHGDQHCKLHDSALLGDAISDLPKVPNDVDIDKMPYGNALCTEYQKHIRLTRKDIFGDGDAKKKLCDHRPYKLNKDDYERVHKIPKKKGANFRDLPGVVVGPDGVAKLDTSFERLLCKSGKNLVPNYALKFEGGRSKKPFGRLSMDEIVSTVVTRPQPHNQVLLHPDQDRVLSVREMARLQGFPDCYTLCGRVKDRYTQVGNAVSFAVSIPLGWCLVKALQGVQHNTSWSLPFKFPDCLGQIKSLRENSE